MAQKVSQWFKKMSGAASSAVAGVVANLPEKMEETGTEALLDLINNYQDIYIERDVDTFMDSGVWRMGNIVFKKKRYVVSYRDADGNDTFLFCVPALQRRAVDRAMRTRMAQVQNRPRPVRDKDPIATELRSVADDIKRRHAALPNDKNRTAAAKQLYEELRRSRRDIFVRIANQTLGKNK